MDTEDQIPAEDALNYLLGRARLFILDLISFIDTALARLPASPSRQVLAYLTRRALLPAETALRRAILLIASKLDMPAPRAPVARPASRPAARPPGRQAPAACAPVFRTSEPPSRAAKADGPPPKTEYLPEHLLPRIRTLTDAVLSAPPPPPLPAPVVRDPGARFFRRFAALRQAYKGVCPPPTASSRPCPLDTPPKPPKSNPSRSQEAPP